jgi:hypothetical protein
MQWRDRRENLADLEGAHAQEHVEKAQDLPQCAVELLSRQVLTKAKGFLKNDLWCQNIAPDSGRFRQM